MAFTPFDMYEGVVKVDVRFKGEICVRWFCLWSVLVQSAGFRGGSDVVVKSTTVWDKDSDS